MRGLLVFFVCVWLLDEWGKNGGLHQSKGDLEDAQSLARNCLVWADTWPQCEKIL